MYIDLSRLRRKSEARTIAAKHRLNTQKYKTDEEKKKRKEFTRRKKLCVTDDVLNRICRKNEQPLKNEKLLKRWVYI